ncbi:MAG: vitamin K epoxide reductase family protein [Candidatus Vogelbacteria bacterium]|nr:vitamin K epoxide reductase family protein [Candidatus Vogelbacteria bacterium]
MAPPQPRLNWGVWFLLSLALVGFADASYLTIQHYIGGPLPCSLLKGCQSVTTSSFATIGPVPIALLGAVYYLIIFVLLLAYFDGRGEKFLVWVSRLSEIGFFASVWLVYLQIFVIKALCLYCLTSAASSTLLFLISTIMVWRKKS